MFNIRSKRIVVPARNNHNGGIEKLNIKNKAARMEHILKA